MNKLQKTILISSLMIMCGVLFFGNTAKADSPDFEIIPKSDPIFNIDGFIPGDEAFGEITFENNTDSFTQTVTFKVKNYQDENNPLFGDVLYFKVKEGDVVILGSTLTNFNDSEGVFELQPGTKTLDFIIYFDKAAGNDYNIIEEKTGEDVNLVFDLEFIAVWDEGTTTGEVAGASISPSGKKTIVEKIGKILGAAAKTGGSILIILLVSALLSFVYYFKKKGAVRS